MKLVHNNIFEKFTIMNTKDNNWNLKSCVFKIGFQKIHYYCDLEIFFFKIQDYEYP